MNNIKNVEQKQLQINNRNYNANVSNSTVAKNVNEVSQVDLSHSHFTTFDSGKVIPIYWEEALPRDYFRIKCSGIIRMSTPATNTMTNPIMSINFFFISNTSMWKYWKQFMGESPTAGYSPVVNSVPYLAIQNLDGLPYTENDLFSYLGFPEYKLGNGTPNIIKLNVLPIIAYCKAWNDWYRDQNLDDDIDLSFVGSTPDKNYFDIANWQRLSAIEKKDFHLTLKYGKNLGIAFKLPDYFVSCLPYPQKGDALNIGVFDLQDLYIGNFKEIYPEAGATDLYFFNPQWLNDRGVSLSTNSYIQTGMNTGIAKTYYSGSGGNPPSGNQATLNLGVASRNKVKTAYSVNDLRKAITLQHYFELDARFGTRYNEYLYSHFGVSVNPLEIDRAEMIGSYEDSLKISSVPQTSSSTNTQPLGSIGGTLMNEFSMDTITVSCEQHGYIFGMLVVRSPIYYSQGIDRKFTRLTKFDYFDPLFNNIGEQPVFNYELFYTGEASKDNSTFGYNEAWADYRYTKNRATGYLSVNSPNSISDLYLYQQKYSNCPKLSKEWGYFPSDMIRNTLFTTSSDTIEFYHQFMGNFNFDVLVDREISLYGTPGVDRV